MNEEEKKAAYIQAMIAYTGDDVRVVQLRITAVLSIAVLFLTQLPFRRLVELGNDGKVMLCAGLAAMALAALAYFWYLAAVHHSKTNLAACLETLDAAEAKRIAGFSGTVWNDNKVFFRAGDILFGLGGALLAGVLGFLLW